MSVEASWQICHVTKSCCSSHIFISIFPNATCRSRQWCRISTIELHNYLVTMKRFHWRRYIGFLPSPPYVCSCMPDQLLKRRNAAYSVRYITQREVSAKLWNVRTYSWSVYTGGNIQIARRLVALSVLSSSLGKEFRNAKANRRGGTSSRCLSCRFIIAALSDQL